MEYPLPERIGQHVRDPGEARLPPEHLPGAGGVEDERPIEPRAPRRVGTDAEGIERPSRRGLGEPGVYAEHKTVQRPLHTLERERILSSNLIRPYGWRR